MSARDNIVREFISKGYATSARLVEIAGFRYSARLHELRKKGFKFHWDFRRSVKTGRKTKTTIYIMLTPKDNIDKQTLEIIGG